MLLAVLFGFSCVTVQAGETSTNWDWLNFKLIVSKTNFFIGDKIPATLVVSNIVKNEHVLRYSHDWPCTCGFGTFSVTEVATGNKYECNYRFDGAMLSNSRILMQSHQSKGFDFDLSGNYTLTNPGVYCIRGVAWFPLSEPPTDRRYTNVITPPIFIILSPKAQAK